MACARAGHSPIASRSRPRRRCFRARATSSSPTARSPRCTAGARSTPCCRPKTRGTLIPRADLAGVAAPQLLDLGVAERLPAVSVEELSRVTGAVVVLQRPHAGGQVDLRIAQARAADVDQR